MFVNLLKKNIHDSSFIGVEYAQVSPYYEIYYGFIKIS